MKKLCLLAVLVLGCNEDGRTTIATTDQTAALCDLYRVACARQAECGVYLYNRTTDVARCEAQLACEEVASGFAAADVAISIPSANECRDALAGATCEGLVLFDDQGIPSALTTVLPACTTVFEGQRDEGESCGWAQQCASGLTCAGETCPGTCVDVEPACRPGSCDAGAYCASDGTCIARGAQGAACGVADPFENTCNDGLYCEIPFAELEGICVPALPRGTTCTTNSFFTCENGDVCAGLCRAPTALGADCGSSDECGIDAFCAFDAGNVCTPTRALGETCTFAGFECGRGASCDETTHTCVANRAPDAPRAPGVPKPFVGEGERCELANCAAGLACRPIDDVWTCQRAPALGESCRPADPNDEFGVLLSGTHGVGGCLEGVCDVFGSWTCVAPAAPGEPCAMPGLTAACASAICKPDGRCADYFEECPF